MQEVFLCINGERYANNNPAGKSKHNSDHVTFYNSDNFPFSSETIAFAPPPPSDIEKER